MLMHRRTAPPACWTERATERCAWSHDRGAACGNASDPEQILRLLDYTPGCAGCSRLERGLAVHMGAVEALVPEPRGTNARGDNPAADAPKPMSGTSVAVRPL